jgi:hypothetical protein
MPEAAPAAAPIAAEPQPAQVAAAPAAAPVTVAPAAPAAAAPAAVLPKPAMPATPAASKRELPAPMPASSLAMHTSMRPSTSGFASAPYAAPAPSPTPPPQATAPAAPAPGPVLVMRPTGEDAPAAAAPAAPAQAAAPAVKPRAAGGIDALLDDALSPEAKRAEQARNAQAAQTQKPLTVPVTPSRDDVAHTMSGMQLAIRGCAMGQTGVANAALMVRYDGRVSTVQVTGAPFGGTASGRCMEGVLRNAQFPRFRQPTFTVRYPFTID